MTATDPTNDPSTRHSVRLKKIGLTVLIAGFVVSGIVYWFGNRPRDFGDDAATIGFYKPEARQMGMLYGQMGVMMDDLLAALKRPGVQALIIIAVAVIFSLICFHLARPRDLEEERLAGLPEQPGQGDPSSSG